tara:strand:- start:2272 stop:3315 length:1044 start_codon:yes stop_codon:yes gene_type:complete
MNISVLGIVGGGQLASLLTEAAKKLKIKTIILSDDIDAPAKNFAEKFIYGKYDDESIVNEFINSVDLVTYEFENIPNSILNKIEYEKVILPKPKINKLVRNRLTEKDFLNKNNIRTTNYASVNNFEDVKLNQKLLPGLLKTCTLGYDGKGQFIINKLEDLNDDFDFTKKYILEKKINLKQEISVVITRYGHQKYEIYEPIENVHEDQILKYSKIPANISDKIMNKSKEWAMIIAEELDYIGTLCVEYFIDKNENIYANEIAPRVHNSGHLTINTHNISQFENHIRAICGLKQINIKKIYNAKMINLLGDEILPYREKYLKENEFFFDYLKKDIKPKRKMGHLTIIEK